MIAKPLLKYTFMGLGAKAAGEAAGTASVTKDPQDITEAGALGTRALTILKPQGVDKNAAKPAELASQVDIRDRLWTLLVQRYNAHLWRAGAWLFYGDVDSHVPPLMSRKSSLAGSFSRAPSTPCWRLPPASPAPTFPAGGGWRFPPVGATSARMRRANGSALSTSPSTTSPA